MVGTTQTALEPSQNSVSKLKLKDPKEYSGKPATPFTLWWKSVCEYIGFYSDSTNMQHIVWIGTVLMGMVWE